MFSRMHSHAMLVDKLNFTVDCILYLEAFMHTLYGCITSQSTDGGRHKRDLCFSERKRKQEGPRSHCYLHLEYIPVHISASQKPVRETDFMYIYVYIYMYTYMYIYIIFLLVNNMSSIEKLKNIAFDPIILQPGHYVVTYSI